MQQETVRKQPVQSRSRATYDAVTEATVQVLLRDGWPSLTTTRVADRAGVSVGTLYQYFPNKRALVEVVRVKYFELMSQTLGQALAQNTDDDLKKTLENSIDALVRVKRDNLDLSKALSASPSDTTHPDFASEIVDHFAGVLLPILQRHCDEPSQSGIELRAKSTVAAAEGLLSYAVKNHPDWLSQPWFVEYLKHIVLESLGPILKADGS